MSQKSKNVSPRWTFKLLVLFNLISQKMFNCNSAYFFERLEKFLMEFKDLEYVVLDDNFLKKFKENTFVCNELFNGIITTRLWRPKNPLLLYLEDMKLSGSFDPSEQKPMEEKYFFVLWYALTVEPEKAIGLNLKPLDKSCKYHFSVNIGEEKPYIVYVTFECKNDMWYYEAQPTAVDFDDKKKIIYHYLEKK